MNTSGIEKQKLLRLNKYDLEIDTQFMSCRVFWARTVNHEKESLFTQYTKHTFYELQYALDGHIGMLTDRGDLYVAESEFVVIPPDTFHQVIDVDSCGSRFIMAFAIEFKDARGRKVQKQLEDLTIHKETSHMRQLLSIMLDKKASIGDIRKQGLLALTESFILEMLSAASFDGDASEKELYGKERIAQMLKYIKNHAGRINVSALARKYNISTRHLDRIFAKEIGRSPREVIDHEKLKKIEEYILTTKLSLGEIAQLCGFCDGYAMNKFFKKHTKTTPSEFKKLSIKGKK